MSSPAAATEAGSSALTSADVDSSTVDGSGEGSSQEPSHSEGGLHMDTTEERTVKVEEEVTPSQSEVSDNHAEMRMEVEESEEKNKEKSEERVEMKTEQQATKTETGQDEDSNSKFPAGIAAIAASTASAFIEETDSNESSSRASSRTDLTREDTMDYESLKLTMKRKKDRPQVPSIMCSYKNFDGTVETGCKQRAILGFKFCIRHILNDPSAPYVQCQHHRKPKTKKDTATCCTNAIKIREGGETEKYCSTHLIMNGLKEAKRKVPLSSSGATVTATTGPVSVASALSTGSHLSAPIDPINSVYMEGGNELSARQQLAFGEGYHHSTADVKDFRGRGARVGAAANRRLPPQQAALGSSSGCRFLLPDQSRAFLNRLSPSEKVQLKAKIGRLLKKSQPQEWNRRDRHILQIKTIIRLIRMPSLEMQKRLQKAGRNIPLNVLQLWRQAMANKIMAIRMSRFPVSHLIKYPEIASRLLTSGTIRNPKHREALEQIRSSGLSWLLSPSKAAHLSMPPPTQPPTAFPHPSTSCSMQSELGSSYSTADPSTSSNYRFDSNGQPLPAIKSVIKIRPKRQKKKMVGIYRMIPGIEPICQMLEDSDFDRTDLFPLGLEPSDDEDEELPQLPLSASFHNLLAEHDPFLQTYLLKKQLRLERQTLIREAQINAPIMQNIRRFPNSIGAILRQRHEEHLRPPQRPAEPIRRCAFLDQNTKERCDRTCVPQANHCNFHILTNVNQKQFSYCAESFCRKPVNTVDVLLWDGKCELHRCSREEKYGPAPIYEEDESGDEDSANGHAAIDTTGHGAGDANDRHDESEDENWEQLNELDSSSSSISPLPTRE